MIEHLFIYFSRRVKELRHPFQMQPLYIYIFKYCPLSPKLLKFMKFWWSPAGNKNVVILSVAISYTLSVTLTLYFKIMNILLKNVNIWLECKNVLDILIIMLIISNKIFLISNKTVGFLSECYLTCNKLC